MSWCRTSVDLVSRYRRSFVRSLPDQLDTMVAERGCRLSGAEHQRMTIVRLLLAQPRVVIVDEGRARLDLGGRRAGCVQRGERRTAMVLAHRLSPIRSEDLILVVKNG